MNENALRTTTTTNINVSFNQMRSVVMRKKPLDVFRLNVCFVFDVAFFSQFQVAKMFMHEI